MDKRSHYLNFALFACFGVILNQLLFFKGLQLKTATNASLLAVMTPVFAILVSIVVGNDKLTWLKTAGTILAGGGVVFYERGVSRKTFSEAGDQTFSSTASYSLTRKPRSTT